MDRALFEADLRPDATARAADFVGAGVSGLVRTHEGWRLSLDDGRTIAARRLIDAGVPEGWWYTAMLPDGDRLVAFHADADTAALRRVLGVGPVIAALDLPGMKEAIGSVDARLAADPKFCSANSVARGAAGDGWLAAGDSAMALDPLSSQGLFNALATGVEAGEATRASLAGDSGATRAYAARMSRIWQAYVGHHALYYGMEMRWPDAPFWARRTVRGQAPDGVSGRSAHNLPERRPGNQGKGVPL